MFELGIEKRNRNRNRKKTQNKTQTQTHNNPRNPAHSPTQPEAAHGPLSFFPTQTWRPVHSSHGPSHFLSPRGPANEPAHPPALARARFFPSWAGPNTPTPARPKPRPHPAPHILVPARTAAHSAPLHSRSAAASADSPAPPVRTSSLLPFPAPRNRARNGRRDHRGSLSPARMPRSRHPFKLTPRPPCASSSTNAPPLTLAAPPPPSSAAKGPLRRRGSAAPPQHRPPGSHTCYVSPSRTAPCRRIEGSARAAPDFPSTTRRR